MTNDIKARMKADEHYQNLKHCLEDRPASVTIEQGGKINAKGATFDNSKQNNFTIWERRKGISDGDSFENYARVTHHGAPPKIIGCDWGRELNAIDPEPWDEKNILADYAPAVVAAAIIVAATIVLIWAFLP